MSWEDILKEEPTELSKGKPTPINSKPKEEDFDPFKQTNDEHNKRRDSRGRLI